MKNSTKIFFIILLCSTFKLNAQTNFTSTEPPKKPYILTKGDSLEELLGKWKTTIVEIQKQEKANDKDFMLFTNFYQTYLDSEKTALYKQIRSRKINYTNVEPYLADKKIKLQSLYQKFVDIKKEFPSSVEEPGSLLPVTLPPVCNPSCTNMDFATGNFTGWYGYYGNNASNNATWTTQYTINNVTGGALGTTTINALDPLTGTNQLKITKTAVKDAFLKTNAAINMSEASPWGSGYSVMLGDSSIPGDGVAILQQKFQVTAATNSLTYAYSVLLENPTHPYYLQPFFCVTLFDANGDTIPNCGKYMVTATNPVGFTPIYYSYEQDTVYWQDWSQVNVPLNKYVGQCVTIQFMVADCGLGAHFGYAYVDASCVSLAITSNTNVLCPNGTAILTATSGEIKYSWIGPAGNSILTSKTNQIVTVDSAGTYTCVVTPITGAACADTIYYTLTKDLIKVTAAATEIKCNGGTGSATANVTSGTAPFTYAWTPSGGSNITAAGITAGSYTVTVHDANSCEATASVVLTQPTLLTATMGNPTGATCGTLGSATVTVTGGTIPYTYLWANSGGTGATGTGLSTGAYTVTVTDNNGCIATATVTITQTTGLLTTISSTGAFCNLYNGSATVNVISGTSPYTYAWNPPAGQTTATATGISAGSYTVVVTDHNDCSSTVSVTVTQPPAVSASLIGTTPVSCYLGTNGTATATATGGATPYTYLWTPGTNTNSQAIGLSAGTYTLTVTDNNNCTSTTEAVITQPPLLTATAGVPINPLCNGGTGSASVSVTGGTIPYTYAWTSGGTTANVSGLLAGTYTVTVTDNNGCISTATVTITQPTALNTTISFTGAFCNMYNGSATVNVTGGTTPYTYLWSTTPAQTTATAGSVSAGTYSILVTDNNDCTVTASVTVTQSPAVIVTMGTPTDPVCNGETGSVNVTATGGALPYTYTWTTTPVQTTDTATGLSAGTYTVNVTDNNNCTSTAIVTITQPPLLTAIMGNPIDPLCYGGTGSATVNVTGGTLPYTYSWSPSGGNAATAAGLSPAIYTVTVTDNNGCTSTASVTITEPTALGNTISFTGAFCNLSNGSATVNVTGGTLPYTYLWSTNPPQTNATAMGISAGTYSVIVIDNNECTTNAIVTVTQPSTITAAITGSTNVSCFSGNNGTATVTAIGGTLPYTYIWTPSLQTTTTAIDLTAGTYTVAASDSNGCVATATVIINQPPLLTAIMGVPTYPLCNGGTGSATVTVTGGTVPYTYAWTSGSTNAIANGLLAGSYTVTVTDNNDCVATATITITQPALLKAITKALTYPLCNGGVGSATVTVTGGTLPYTYRWQPTGQTTANASDLSAGTYTIIVFDHNGCIATADVTITQPTLLATTTTVINVLCYGGTGSIIANPTGGTPPYIYSWTPSGGVSATANNLSAGIYTVMVTDANRCQATAIGVVTQPAVLSVTLTGPKTLCSGSPGTLIASVTGGTTPYAYSWSTPITSLTSTATVSPTVTTTYSVTITDADGCQASGQFSIYIAPPLVLTTTGSTAFCSGKSATLCAIASGGTGGDTYLWQPGGETMPCITVSPTISTTYTVSVTDNCNITVTDTATVQIHPNPDVSFHAYLYQGCIPFCVRLYNTSTISSGYIQSYAWKFGDGDTSSKASPQDCYPNPGVYTVSLTATSNFGCSATLTKPDLMTAFPLPVAAFTYSPNPGVIILSPTIQFTDQSTPASATAPIVQWTWPTFGDATDSTSIFENPEHTYQDTGRYCPELVVEDIHGCKDSVTNCLDVEPFFTLYIPSAFSPNGDGLDDTFFPKGVYVKTFEMYIFDRWGEQLYHTNNINQGWDGTVKGGTTVSQEDTYVYKIIATDWQNNVHNYIGRVTLLR